MVDKRQEITRRHNRLLNILLALYVTLCLIFALLYNGFFIKPKAYTMNDNADITFSGTCSGGETYNQTGTLYTNYTLQPERGIFFYNEELEEMMGTYVNNRFSSWSQSSGLCYVYYGGGINYNVNYSSIDGAPSALHRFQAIGVYNGANYNPFIKEFGFNDNNIPGCDYVYGGVEGQNVYGFNLTSDIQYVDNGEDLYKYLVLEDDSVVKTGDPTHPVEVESSNIPTPQKVKIINDGKCPTIAWDNPKRALQFGDKLKVKIDFKPTFTLWMGLSPISEELVCQDWIVAFEDFLNSHNAFSIKQNSSSILPNDLNAYNYIVDDQYIFDTSPVEDYAKSYIKMVIDQNGDTSLVPYGVGQPPTQARNLQKKLNAKSGVVGGNITESLWDTLAPEALATIKGLFDGGQVRNCQFRIRYEVQDGNKLLVSPWVNATKEFDVNGNSTSDTDITFSDKDDTPIQNPTYLPATSTNVSPVSSDAWWMNFNGYTGTMFENLTQQMSDWTGDTGGFVGFFGELFNEFPFLSWCLLFSLSLAIFLRIFGR